MSDQPASYEIESRDGTLALVPKGNWITPQLADVPQRLAADFASREGAVCIDTQQLGRIDTGGAYAIIRAIGRDRDVHFTTELRPDMSTLAELVRPALDSEPSVPASPNSVWQTFDRIGRGIVSVGHDVYRGQVFLGQLMAALGRTIVQPRRLRTKALVATMEQAGLAGLPIVVIMTFFIGAVLALVGSTMLQTLGVKVYSVELVGIGILREFGAVIAAILFAGRSASAFTAQIGSMRMNQEIDAMRVMGIDIFDALVVPRVLAALIMLPVMTFMADLGGITGGMLVAWSMMGIEPTFFLHRLVDSVGAQQFWVGMAKAPLFALAVATIGCRQGMEVGGDVEELGVRVTSSVVQSIFTIIMFDALFAVLYQRAGL